MDKKRTAVAIAFLAAAIAVVAIIVTKPDRGIEDAGDGPLKAIAGEYFFGDGLGQNCLLTILADNRFRYRLDGCMGNYGKNHGKARLEGTRLRLSPEQACPIDLGGLPRDPSVVRGGQEGAPCDFEVVRWGPRTYLIPDSLFPRFCDAANVGWEPRDAPMGKYYLRSDDWGRAVVGLPEVPTQWKGSLVEVLARGRITGRTPDGAARISLGERNGVTLGSRLWIGPTATQKEPVELLVREVDQVTCVARVERGDLSQIVYEPVVLRAAKK